MIALRTYRFAILLLALSILDTTSSRAWGSEDSGIRSVFAFGAGNRALGLGGAYAATADDASAAIWNPGGLGRLQRRMLEISHTSMYGMGLNEQYAAFVLPSWRWGTAGITLRHFGVDGVDVRDTRNFLLRDDESESQMEVGLSYGRPLGAAWNLGGTLKIQRQKTLDFADTGFGIDLGMIVHPGRTFNARAPWTDRFTVGLAIRNLLEPSIRLDQDNAKDPSAMRLGMAYWIPFTSGRALLAAVDVEKTKDMDTRAHLGLEARIHPMLSLRTGLNAGMLTAGTGFRWGDVSFDYVYENNEIHSVHRFGASLGFGMTVQESRQAAHDAETALLGARLTAALQQHQSQRVQELLVLAETALVSQRYKEALDLLGTARVLEPGNGSVSSLEAKSLLGMARQLEGKAQYTNAALTYGRVLAIKPSDETAKSGVTRCRTESDRRATRNAEIRNVFQQALEAFAAEDFAEARKRFDAVLQISPDDSEAATMLSRTKNAINRRGHSLVEIASRLVTSGSHAEAAILLEQARNLDPQTPGLDKLQERIITAKATEAGYKRSEDTAPTHPGAGISMPTQVEAATTARLARVDAELQGEYKDLYKRGEAALQDGRHDDAVRYWELVWSANPNHQQVNEHLTNEYLIQGMQAFSQGLLADAIRHWEKALRVDPTEEKAIGYLLRAQEQLNRTREILGDSE